MKVIDKIQDFYEFESYMYGEPDTSVIWKRNTKTHNFKNDYTRQQQKELNKLISKFIYSDGSLNSSYYNIKNNIVKFSQFLVGIYPYVYLCIDVSEYKHSTYLGRISLQPIWSYKLTESDFKNHDILKELVNESIIDKKANMARYLLMTNINKEFGNYCFYSDTHYKDYNDPFIKECPELFKLLDTPTFIITTDNGNISEIKTDAIIMNSGLFQHYTREDLDKNIYSNIEQFIIEKNTMEIKEPDNKTKIVNAGFDLKTSFRNM